MVRDRVRQPLDAIQLANNAAWQLECVDSETEIYRRIGPVLYCAPVRVGHHDTLARGGMTSAPGDATCEWERVCGAHPCSQGVALSARPSVRRDPPREYGHSPATSALDAAAEASDRWLLAQHRAAPQRPTRVAVQKRSQAHDEPHAAQVTCATSSAWR